MKLSLFFAVLVSLMIAFASAATAGGQILGGLDDAAWIRIGDDVLDDLFGGLNGCEDDSGSIHAAFLQCVGRLLRAFGPQQINNRDTRTIKRLARGFQFEAGAGAPP
jgi:hypothetical protein